MYRSWIPDLPNAEIFLVQLPGRDNRIKEFLPTRLMTIIEPLTEAIMRQIDEPFAFFGHSMGALIAFETARELRRRQALQPVHLFVSARHAPQEPDPYAELYLLPEQEFIIKSESLFGALPEIVKQDPEALKLFVAILRSDLTMLGTYRYTHESALSTPISVFGGTQDGSVTEKALQDWSEQTTNTFAMQMIAGDHFFIQSSRDLLLAYINRILPSSL